MYLRLMLLTARSLAERSKVEYIRILAFCHPIVVDRGQLTVLFVPCWVSTKSDPLAEPCAQQAKYHGVCGYLRRRQCPIEKD